MKIIDAHMHFSNIQSFKDAALYRSGVDYSGAGYLEECKQNNVVAAIGMGVTELAKGRFPDTSSNNPMGLDLEDKVPERIYTCLGINPYLLTGITKELELREIEREMEKPHVVGIKIYAGYYHKHVYDEVYDEVYDLASKYNLPVVIHSGDTYSERGLLKYSHPLHIDELAVKRRDLNFIIAHIGDPWVMDCAELVAKNANVYADVSGLIIGDRKEVERFDNQRLFHDHIQRALVYTDNYKKYLFGSDWPIVELGAYIDFIKGMVPEEFHDLVFYENAKKLFRIDV